MLPEVPLKDVNNLLFSAPLLFLPPSSPALILFLYLLSQRNCLMRLSPHCMFLCIILWGLKLTSWWFEGSCPFLRSFSETGGESYLYLLGGCSNQPNQESCSRSCLEDAASQRWNLRPQRSDNRLRPPRPSENSHNFSVYSAICPGGIGSLSGRRPALWNWDHQDFIFPSCFI